MKEFKKNEILMPRKNRLRKFGSCPQTRKGMKEFKKNEILMPSGIVIDVRNPKQEQILFSDIAHGLSRIIRFGGRFDVALSVAEHSILVSRRVESPEHKLSALMHDASEAYLGDVISAVKNLCPGYQKLERRFMEVIAEKFGFALDIPEVKQADKEVMQMELSALLGNSSWIERGRLSSQEDAKLVFTNIYNTDIYNRMWKDIS